MAEARFSINVHVNDDVKFDADRIPSDDKDFVALKIGWQASILLMNPAQAKALAVAAADSYAILKQIEIERERKEMASIWTDDDAFSVDEDLDGPDYYGSDCSIENPCEECLSYDEQPYDYEPF